jgi:hypothetical protein
MGAIPTAYLRHTVTVRPYLGQGGAGPLYGPPVAWRCLVEAKRRKVRDSLGDEVVSGTTVRGLLGPDWAPKSEVTLPDSRIGYVIVSAPHDGGGLATPDHLELALT